MFALLATLALTSELAFGYPRRILTAIGHPVMWIGTLIALLDRAWNHADDRVAAGRMFGVAALLVVVGAAALPAAFVQWQVAGSILGVAIAALLASSLIAQRSLGEHVAAVAEALETQGLAGGRRAVSAIVGRDPESLDEAGVSRAAIESLAENFSDGIVAPAFWLVIGGLPGIAAYKAINTADSMIGHRTPRHLHFGWAAAKVDDLVNLPASRLSALLLVLAACLTPGASGAGAWRAVRRDARHHRSPNAGWPEAAMAGALGIALAGPRSYGGKLVDDAMMGDGGRRDASAQDIRRALHLYWIADAMLLAFVALIAVAIVTARM